MSCNMQVWRQVTPDVAKLPLTSMKVSKVPHLSRKSSLRYRKCHACHANRPWGLESAMPVTQNAAASIRARMSASFHRPLWRSTKCHTCHANRPWGLESATLVTQNAAASIRPRMSPSFRRPLWRCRKCHTCHANRPWDHQSAAPVTQNAAASIRPRMSASFRRPLWRSRKWHTCHANRAWGTESATPVTQNAAAPQVTRDVAQLPLTSMKVSKVSHLSRKSSLRYRKCHACHAKRRGATGDPGCRQASADLYEGLESATPVTQIEPEVPKVPRLSRKTPRRHRWPGMSPSFRWPLWRPRKCHTCHANRAWGTESATPVTQNAAAPEVTRDVAKLPLTSMKVSKVPHLSRKSSLRYRKCHACHAKRRGATGDPGCRQASADLYEGLESAWRWSVALRTFYRQFFLCYIGLFSSETSAPGSPGNYLYTGCVGRDFVSGVFSTFTLLKSPSKRQTNQGIGSSVQKNVTQHGKTRPTSFSRDTFWKHIAYAQLQHALLL